MGIRVLVIDDNPHVRWHGRVYPVNATFHRFLSAFLDLEGSPVASITHAVPLRDLPDDAAEPVTLPLDPRIRVVGTAPFDGIAGFLRRAPAITRRNAPILRAALAEADLMWLKVPASNALLATWLARRLHVPRFVYVAGSARGVVAGQGRGIVGGLAARAVAAAYDIIGWLVAIGGQRVVVGEKLLTGGGVVTSLVEPQEVRQAIGPWPQNPSSFRLVWAGRLADGKGVETLIDALALLQPLVTLTIVGDGPARDRLTDRSRSQTVASRIEWRGYLAERSAYMSTLAGGDVFVFPSHAEGFPKVVLDAMAAGLPVVASAVGALADLCDAGTIRSVAAGDAPGLAASLQGLMDDPVEAGRLRREGLALAAAHTRRAEAGRLVARWRAQLPALAWR